MWLSSLSWHTFGAAAGFLNYSDMARLAGVPGLDERFPT
jgi:hypothetical protein